MARPAARIQLTEEEEATLRGWLRSGSSEQRLVYRARIVLAAGAGKSTEEIADELKIVASQVSKWRGRFARLGLAGLQDAPRGGRPPRYDEATEKRILAVLDEKPPKGHAKWNGRLVAERLGDVSADHVWKVLEKHRISLQRRRSWCLSTDPEFARKAAEIVGLYLAPPDNAVVLCVDEKPHIQALERAQGWLKLPNGKAVTGENHRYKRHGTTTLFAALETATGLVRTGHYKRRTRRDFLDFMNGVTADWPDREIHVILDNLSTHKPKRDRWLARHKNVHFHFTPTNGCFLNQIEIWFSILSRQALQGASFTSPRQLRQAIDDFVEVWNPSAAPFEWTKTVVRPKGFTNNYANLRD